jgi:PAS domain-containing protein
MHASGDPLRTNIERTQLIPRPGWDNPRVRLLSDSWLLTIVAILTATAVPWFASGFEVDLGAASWGLLALGGILITLTILESRTSPRGRWRGRALTLLDVIGVIVIGFIWRQVGALQNPAFLTVFALPVIGAIFLSRWHPYLISAVAVCVVGVVALAQAPELRWHASGLLGSDTLLSALFGGQSAAAAGSFPGFYAPSSYLIVLLEVFSVGLFACAVAAEYVGTVFERLSTHTALARSEAERGQELWASLIERLPLPALLIDPASLRIAACSDSAIAYLQSGETPLEGRNLFETVRFSYPDIVQELIVGPDGEEPSTVIRVSDQLRVTRLRVLHVAHKGQRLALLTIEDATEVFCLKAALDTSEYAALVIDGRGRVLAFNKPAIWLFSGAKVGADATQLLSRSNGGQVWWEPGLTSRRKMHLEIGQRIYQVTSSAITLEGEQERIFAVSVLPVAKGETADPFGTGTAVLTGIARQLR